MVEANSMASLSAPEEKSQDVHLNKSGDARTAEHVEYTTKDGDLTSEEEEPVVTFKTWVVVFVIHPLAFIGSCTYIWTRFYPWAMGSPFGPSPSSPTSEDYLAESSTLLPSMFGLFQ
jgi:hypothetical protein